MHFNDTIPAKAYCGGLAIICSILLLLFAAEAIARPAHHQWHREQAQHSEVQQEPRIVEAKLERRRGPAHHRSNAARPYGESESRASSDRIHR